MLAAVQQNGSALEYASKLNQADGFPLHQDLELLRAAVQNDGNALQYASDELKQDRGLVLAAVAQSGSALQHAPDYLRKDCQVVLTAMKQDGGALADVSPDLIDKDFALAAAVHLLTGASDKLLFRWVQQASRANQLAAIIRSRQGPSVASISDAEGRRAIDIACGPCKQAMEEALRLFGVFEVDSGPPLHVSRTACVFGAKQYRSSQNFTSVALKGMHQVDQVLAELKGREGLDPKYVLARSNQS